MPVFWRRNVSDRGKQNAGKNSTAFCLWSSPSLNRFKAHRLNGSACRQHVPKAFLIDRHDDPGFLASLRPVVGIGQRLPVGWPEFRVHVHGACRSSVIRLGSIRIAAASTSQTYWLKALSLANCCPAYVDSKSFFHLRALSGKESLIAIRGKGIFSQTSRPDHDLLAERRPHNDARRFRIEPPVELGGRGHIAGLEKRAAHKDHPRSAARCQGP